MNATLTFFFGLFILLLFAWYFLTDKERTKRWLGTTLALLLCAFSIDAFLPFDQKIHLGLDLQGGTSFLVRLVPPVLEEGGKPRPITPEMQEQAVEVIRKRVDEFGVSEPVITKEGTDHILVQIPGLSTAQVETARQQLQKVAKLEFRLVHPNSDQLVRQIQAGTAFTPPGYVILTSIERRSGQPEKLLIKRRPELTGQDVASARPVFETRGYEVSLKLTRAGAETFRRVTRDNINNRLAIVLDNEVVSAPTIQSEIPNGEAVITGNFTSEEARNLATVMENPLQTPVAIDETRTVSATLGQDSIFRGIAAGLAGLAATLIFVLIYYRAAGLVAFFGLAVNGVLLFGAMALFGFVLTLPGIAGIILTIGMAIDSNVLIYERLREELEHGKSLRPAIETAYRKAFSAIVDSNLTTLLKVAILFWLGSGPVKGFAITLTIGIIASMFSALLVTRNIFAWAVKLNLVKRISMLHLIKSKSFDFLGKWRPALIGSVIFLAASIGAFGLRGSSMFNIDFTGGDFLLVRSATDLSDAQIRSQLAKMGLGKCSYPTGDRPAKRPGRTFYFNSVAVRYGGQDREPVEARISSCQSHRRTVGRGWPSYGYAVGNNFPLRTRDRDLGYPGLCDHPIRILVCHRDDCGNAPRSGNHSRHFRHGRAGIFAGNGRRDPDGRRLFDQRQDRRVRPHSRGTPFRAKRLDSVFDERKHQRDLESNDSYERSDSDLHAFAPVFRRSCARRLRVHQCNRSDCWYVLFHFYRCADCPLVVQSPKGESETRGVQASRSQY